MCQCRKTQTLLGSFYLTKPPEKLNLFRIFAIPHFVWMKVIFFLFPESIFCVHLSWFWRMNNCHRCFQSKTPLICFIFCKTLTPEYKCWRKLFFFNSKIFRRVLWTFVLVFFVCDWIHVKASYFSLFLSFQSLICSTIDLFQQEIQSYNIKYKCLSQENLDFKIQKLLRIQIFLKLTRNSKKGFIFHFVLQIKLLQVD